MSQGAHQTGAYPGFCSMMQQGVFLLCPGWDANPLQVTPSIMAHGYPFIHQGGERHCESKVSGLTTQRNVPGHGSKPDR